MTYHFLLRAWFADELLVVAGVLQHVCTFQRFSQLRTRPRRLSTRRTLTCAVALLVCHGAPWLFAAMSDVAACFCLL